MAFGLQQLRPCDAVIAAAAPLLWLQPDFLASGSVATWRDRSGKGNSPTQGTGANQPTRTTSSDGGVTRPAVTADGSNDNMEVTVDLSAYSKLTLVAALRSDGADVLDAFVSTFDLIATPPGFEVFYFLDDVYALCKGNVSNSRYSGTDTVDAVLKLRTYEWDFTKASGSEAGIWEKGSLVTGSEDLSAENTGSFAAGMVLRFFARRDGTAFFDGPAIADVVLIGGYPSLDVAHAVERAIRLQWGIA